MTTIGQWGTKIQLKDLLTNEDVEPEQAQEIGRQFAARLSARFKRRLEDDSELYDIVDEFTLVEDQEHFNDVLACLYDWADAERVWIA